LLLAWTVATMFAGVEPGANHQHSERGWKGERHARRKLRAASMSGRGFKARSDGRRNTGARVERPIGSSGRGPVRLIVSSGAHNPRPARFSPTALGVAGEGGGREEECDGEQA